MKNLKREAAGWMRKLGEREGGAGNLYSTCTAQFVLHCTEQLVLHCTICNVLHLYRTVIQKLYCTASHNLQYTVVQKL